MSGISSAFNQITSTIKSATSDSKHQNSTHNYPSPDSNSQFMSAGGYPNQGAGGYPGSGGGYPPPSSVGGYSGGGYPQQQQPYPGIFFI